MLKFLGSGGAFNLTRGNNCAYFEFGTELFLIDAGEDVFQKLIRYHLLKGKMRIHIFITHLHSDHIGSLGTIIAYLYFRQFCKEGSNICVYFPSESIRKYLLLQGVPNIWYNLFVNRWDELYIDGSRKKPEYSFYPVPHTEQLNYNGYCNTYAIEFSLQDEFSIYYSGDTNVFHENLNNIWNYTSIYHEVTMNEKADVHFHYSKLLEATRNFTLQDKQKIYLMHLDEDFDEERAKRDGFCIATNIGATIV